MQRYLELSLREHGYSNYFCGLVLTLSNVSTIFTLIPGGIVSSKCNSRQILTSIRCLAILYPTACLMCTIFGLTKNNHALIICFWILKSLIYSFGIPIILQLVFDKSLGYIPEAKITGCLFILGYAITVALCSITPLVQSFSEPDSFDNLMIIHQIIRFIFFVSLAIFIKEPQLKYLPQRFNMITDDSSLDERSDLLVVAPTAPPMDKLDYGTRARR